MKFAEEEKKQGLFFFCKQVIKVKIKGTIEDLKFKKKIKKKRKKE